MDTKTPDRRTAQHSALTAAQRSARARLAATSRWSREDGSKGTQAAREAFMDRFRRQVDPDNTLPEAERERRAEAAKRAHFQSMAFRRHRNTAS